MTPPQKFMEEAREILKNRSFSDDDYDEMQREQAVIDVAKALATHTEKAREEEREMCASIAENISAVTSYPHYQHTAEAIAKSIRLWRGEK